MARPIPDDTRGIIDPDEMLRHVDFRRSPAGDGLDGLVEWFWSVAWQLPTGRVHDQQVLSHPAGNISIGTIDDRGVPLDPAEGRIYGVTTETSHRRLTVTGWTVAARTTVGGLGALLDAPATTATDIELPLVGGVPGLDGRRLLDQVRAAGSNDERVELLRDELGRAVTRRDPARLAEARSVVDVARFAERDRQVRRAEQLASVAGVSVRTLQRMFDQHVGVSPSFVIRRWRIIEAAEAARVATASGEVASGQIGSGEVGSGGAWHGWAAVAAELGYADQAHLTRDFRRHLGTSPSAYLAQVTRGVTPPL